MTVRLSICIATFNRARWIGETLESIVPQLNDQVELVILDGASTDATADVVAGVARGDPRVRYIRAETNSGVDADFDRAVMEARGEYCWLFSDDDTLAPDAVSIVLAALARDNPDLLVVDADVRDIEMKRIFEPRRMAAEGQTAFAPEDRDRFMADAGNALSFIGGVVIHRDAWLARDRNSYYGSLFVHVGVIFQGPPLSRVRILREPLVRIRMGNAMWGPRAFDIWMFKWPQMIWSFAGYSDDAKAAAAELEPWRHTQLLLQYRALGSFGIDAYRAHIRGRTSRRKQWQAWIVASMPRKLAHVWITAWLAKRDRQLTSNAYNLIVASPFSNWVSRAIGRRIGHRGVGQRARDG